MTTARAQRAADLARTAVERAAARSDSYANAAPRRPLHGHTASCPNRLAGRMRRCGLCRAETLERAATVVNGVVLDGPSVLAGKPAQGVRAPDAGQK